MRNIVMCLVSFTTLILIGCGRDKKADETSTYLPYCQSGEVSTADHGCLKTCGTNSNLGFEPSTGRCIQGQNTNCGQGRVWIAEEGACFNSCGTGLSNYGFVNGQCTPGIAGTSTFLFF